MAIKIILDPGHGQYGNPGYIKGHYEGTQMFKLAYFLKPELEKYGIQVVVTRKKLSDDPALSTRGKAAKGYDLFLSLHSNAPGLMPKDQYIKVRGTEVYDSVTRPNKSLATSLGQAISKVMGHSYRGTMYRKGNNGDYYGVLRNAIAVGVPSAMLIEHGYHTNPDDCAFMMKDENLKKIAVAEAKVIAEYYKIIKREDDPNLIYGEVLKRGAKGEKVKRLQLDLIALGYAKYMEPYGADSSFGAATLKAVEAFQKANKLAVDGSVGPATQAKIKELLAKLNTSNTDKQIAELQKQVQNLTAQVSNLNTQIKNLNAKITNAKKALA